MFLKRSSGKGLHVNEPFLCFGDKKNFWPKFQSGISYNGSPLNEKVTLGIE